MEILKNLSEAEMHELKGIFEAARPHDGLSPKSFQHTLHGISQSKAELRGRVSRRYLRHLFADIDVTGTGYVSWDDFTMFAIDQARSTAMDSMIDHNSHRSKRRRHPATSRDRTTEHGEAASSSATASGGRAASGPRLDGDGDEWHRGRSDSAAPSPPTPSSPPTGSSWAGSSTTDGSDADTDTEATSDGGERHGSGHGVRGDGVRQEPAAFRDYHVDHIIPQHYSVTVVEVRLLPRSHRIVQVSEDNRGTSSLSLFSLDGQKGRLYGSTPKQHESITAWEYIPAASGVVNGDAIVCAYNGGFLQLHALEKKHSIDEALALLKTMHVSETQTSLTWLPMYDRLMMGSRGGVVSTWNVDDDRVASQEKLHAGAVTALRIHAGSTLFSASLDHADSVKGVDLERSVVRFAFHDHPVGGVSCLELDEQCCFSTGLEPRIVQRLLQSPKAHPSFLFDAMQPHKGRVSALHRIPSSSLLVSGDTKGTVKLWDLRMGMCVQTLTSATLTSVRNRVTPSSLFVAAGGVEGEAGEVRKQRQRLRATMEAAAGMERDGNAARNPSAAAYLRNKDKRLTERYRSDLKTAKDSKPFAPTTGATTADARGLLIGATKQRVLGTVGRRSASKRNVSTVNAICSLPATQQLVVTTPKEIVTLGCANTACPELADDEFPCRFILFPGDDHILTVHERGVKLWSRETGCVVYCSANNLVSEDISACALVEPLQRQFLLGTMGGEVTSFSVALAQQTADLGSALREAGAARSGSQILALYTLPKFRDYPHAYAVVVTASSVDMAPILTMGECSGSQVVSLHALRAALASQRAAIKDAFLLEDKLYVATTANCVLLANLQLNGALVATFRPPTTTRIDSIHLGRFCVGPHSSQAGETAVAAASEEGRREVILFLAPDNSGKVLVGGSCSPLGSAAHVVYHMLGEWPVTLPRDDDELRAAPASSAVAWRWYRPGSAQVTVQAGEGYGEVSQPVSSDAAGGRGPSVMVTHTYFFSDCGVLATGDERGHVRLWDVLAVAQASASGPMSEARARGSGSNSNHHHHHHGRRQGVHVDPARLAAVRPRFITGWDAHRKGFTAFEGMRCAAGGLPILVTAGIDRRVCLWSADGTRLGSLAMGRQASEASGGGCYELDSYLLSTHAARVRAEEWVSHWRLFEHVLSSRVNAFLPDATTNTPPSSPSHDRQVARFPALQQQQRQEEGDTDAGESGPCPPAGESVGGPAAAIGADETPFFVTEARVGEHRMAGAAAGSPVGPRMSMEPPGRSGGGAGDSRQRSNGSTHTTAVPTLDSPVSSPLLTDTATVDVSSGEDAPYTEEEEACSETAMDKDLVDLACLAGTVQTAAMASLSATTSPASRLRQQQQQQHVAVACGADPNRQRVLSQRCSPTTHTRDSTGPPVRVSLARTGVVSGANLPPIHKNSVPRAQHGLPSATASAIGRSGGSEVLVLPHTRCLDRSTAVRNERRRAKDRKPLLATAATGAGGPRHLAIQRHEEAACATQSLLPSLQGVPP